MSLYCLGHPLNSRPCITPHIKPFDSREPIARSITSSWVQMHSNIFTGGTDALKHTYGRYRCTQTLRPQRWHSKPVPRECARTLWKSRKKAEWHPFSHIYPVFCTLMNCYCLPHLAWPRFLAVIPHCSLSIASPAWPGRRGNAWHLMSVMFAKRNRSDR